MEQYPEVKLPLPPAPRVVVAIDNDTRSLEGRIYRCNGGVPAIRYTECRLGNAAGVWTVEELTPEAVSAMYRKATVIGAAVYIFCFMALGLVMFALVTTVKGPSADSLSELPMARVMFLGVSVLEAGTLSLFKFWTIPSGLASRLAVRDEKGIPTASAPQTFRVFGIELPADAPQSAPPAGAAVASVRYDSCDVGDMRGAGDSRFRDFRDGTQSARYRNLLVPVAAAGGDLHPEAVDLEGMD